ncbi:MAG: nucleotidyltransferase family protein [Akkermansiaceae bacterium]|nr:nucleotidyltransferase family protein [Verrucomicrobiales bacterium]
MRHRIKKAMVLAAGYGTRLKPLTDATPKPLVPVAGKPMIEYALEKLIAYGIEEVVINVSYLKEPLRQYLAGFKRLKVSLSEEPEPLETGGGLRQALPLLGEEPFFTINSDIIWTDEGAGALERLNDTWDSSRMEVLLLAQCKATAIGHDQGEDHLFIKPENTIGWSVAAAPYIVAGLGIIHPRLFANAPTGKFSVKLLWLEALRNGRLFCLPHQGRWFQAGTLADLKQTEACLAELPTGG